MLSRMGIRSLCLFQKLAIFRIGVLLGDSTIEALSALIGDGVSRCQSLIPLPSSFFQDRVYIALTVL